MKFKFNQQVLKKAQNAFMVGFVKGVFRTDANNVGYVMQMRPSGSLFLAMEGELSIVGASDGSDGDSTVSSKPDGHSN